jgi:hypothetical protein
VSNTGNDNNDGKTPQTAWATISVVNGTNFKAGDAVFFKRGDIWRDGLVCKDGVTYSAYGSGIKPRIYGSVENGAGPDNWKLWYKGKNGETIWAYHRPLTDCGGVVFNDGKSYASKVYAFWDGSKYVDDLNHKETFNIVKALKSDLMFYSYFDLKGHSLPIYTYDINTTGTLYLRCDKGNPGKLYKSIEFQTLAKPALGYCGLLGSAGKDVIDNLCVEYGLCQGISSYGSGNNVIQNCEIGWIGGDTHQFTREDSQIPAAGEGIAMQGVNNVAKNNYVHDCFDGGILCEADQNLNTNRNLTIENNVITRCVSGILIAHHAEKIDPKNMLRNIQVKNNDILYTGFGWSCDKKFSSWIDKQYISGINFWDGPDVNNGIYLTNNVLYRSKGALIHLGMPDQYLPKLSGNTYVQDANGALAVWRFKTLTSKNDFQSVLKDKKGVVMIR